MMIVVRCSVAPMRGDVEEVAVLEKPEARKLDPEYPARAVGNSDLFDLGVCALYRQPVGPENSDPEDEVLDIALHFVGDLDRHRIFGMKEPAFLSVFCEHTHRSDFDI